jgi:hypothetical protein
MIFDKENKENRKLDAVIENMTTKYLANPDVNFIDPMGNALTKDAWKKMVMDGEFKLDASQILSFDKIFVFADEKAAVVNITTHSEYFYKGERDDDEKMSCILEKKDGNWKFVHAHWSTMPSTES